MATSRPDTLPRSASTGRARSTACPSRRSATNTRREGTRAERRALWHYRLRGYRVLGTNVWAGGNELDLVVRRGRRLVFVEVKSKSDEAHGDPLEMVGPEKRRRLGRAARAYLAAHPELGALDCSFDVVAVRRSTVERVGAAFEPGW
ncbi:MAG: YraN family protein [Candidatus Rokuibacteriota bacterium]|nr:MAG: YraN family protein [Candidatus Rokubacteria bacterium]